MKTRIYFVFYAVVLLAFALYTWGFVDANMPFNGPTWLYTIVYHNRLPATTAYIVGILLLFGFYALALRFVRAKRWQIKEIVIAIFFTIIGLYVSFPAFSFDIFNYIATAKVAYHYHENPYLVMPIEIANEPMLPFLHASNKVSLYGPSWILLTAVPHYLGFQNVLLSLFAFKAFVLVFYLLLVWLLWRMSQNVYSVAFFALNPLVTIETLIDGHNDVVMMSLALLSFYLIQKKKFGWSMVAIAASILIKYATLFLLPVYLYVLYKKHTKGSIAWPQVYFWSSVSMYIIFLLSPLREELYAWYLLWPMTFVALSWEVGWLRMMTWGFSFGVLLRIVPFLYTRSWVGKTPIIKKIVTFLPVAIALAWYEIRKKI